MNLPAVFAVVGLGCYAALFYVAIASPVPARGNVRRLFAISLVVMVAWQVSALVVSLARRPDVAIAGYQAMTAFVVAFGVSYALFVRTFLQMGDNRVLAVGGSLLSLITSVLIVAARPSIIESVYWNTTTHFFLPRFGPLSPVLGVPYCVMLAYVAYLLLEGYRRAKEPLHRGRIHYLLLGWCIVLAGTLANFVPTLKAYPIDLMANVVNAVLIAYAIFRYQLMDIRLVIREGLAYAIPTTIIAVGYFLTIYAVEKVLAFAGYQVFLLSLLVAAVTAVVAQPLRDRAQLWVDRIFFREKYDAQLMLQELSALATMNPDIDKLTSALLHRLTVTMRITRAWIMLRAEEYGCFRLIAQTGSGDSDREIAFNENHPVVQWLATHKETLARYDVDRRPELQAVLGRERSDLEAIQPEIFVPLVARGDLIGILLLGPKLSRAPYSSDERLTLTTLANQVSISLENAQLLAKAQAEIRERSRAEEALRTSEVRYRSLFEESPIALWEEDFSAVRTYIQGLRTAGIGDLEQYFAEHPEVVMRCASLVNVVHVNKATLTMYNADSVEGFRNGLSMVLGEGTWDAFKEGLLALAAGATRFEREALNRTLTSETRQIDLRWIVAAGYEETWSVVLISTMDITEHKQREAILRRKTARLELLREIDEAILEARPPDKTIEFALRRVRQVLDCEGAGLVTLTVEIPETPSNPLATGHKPEAYRRRDRDVLRELQAGKAYVVGDLVAVPYPLPVIDDLRSAGRRSALFVPVLQRQPNLVDTLVLTADAPKAFGEEEMEVGRELAHSLALAIRNSDMRREIGERTQALERQLARVNLFNEITRAVAARHDLDSILDVVAQRLEDDFTDTASIWLKDGDAFVLAANGERSRRSHTDSRFRRRIVLPAEMPEQKAVHEGRVAYFRNLSRLPLTSLMNAGGHSEMGSVVVAPLMVDGKVFGVIVSTRREENSFSHAEREFLAELGGHVALAIQQAQLHKDLETAYNELRETQRAVMQQDRLRALGEMASGIAHDINNAIAPIPLYVGLIESQSGLDDRSRAFMQTIKTAIKDIGKTVGRMRQFYSKRTDEELAPVAINLAVQQAIELTRPRWRDVPQEHGITIALETDFEDDLPPVLGNDGEIRQAVTNLVLNAVDAMPEGGTLTLRTQQGARPYPHVILEVIDTGTGMDEEIRARAFEPFFSTKGERGSGMGLSTVYGTMQRHGGDVQLETTPGKGSTLRLIFPVGNETSESAVERALMPVPPLRILCVDDEPLLREALKQALEDQGHMVTLADGGQAGLETFRNALHRDQPFQVVITDLGMPHVDGRRVAQAVKTDAPHTPVILLTGWGQQLQAERDFPPGVDIVLSKPPRIETLNRALSQVISRD